MKRFRAWLLIAALASLAGAAAPDARAADEQRCFDQTAYCISGRIREYWEQNGGLPVFGLPVNPVRTELNRDTGQTYQTQWFERNRMEIHPENNRPFDILLGLLGKESLPANLPAAALAREAGPQAGCHWFDVTGHNVCNQGGSLGFKHYWENHGLLFDGNGDASDDESLALFGYPLTAPTTYTNSSGDTVQTQWFERARFEWHPNESDNFKVLLGRLGSETYDPAAATGPIQFHAVQRPGWPAPLEVPMGLTIDEVYSGLISPRFMALDPQDGSLVVADQHANNIVRLRDTNGDSRYDQKQIVAEGFAVMHSVAFVNGALYAADEHRLVRLGNFGPDGRAGAITDILALPTGATDLYGHRTRTIHQGPDGLIYLSVGSSCDVCVEDNPRRATILRLRPDGTNVEIFASGLRNTVDFAWRPYTSELWGADMGRNNIGPGIPPEELNLLEQGKNYGWPYCYGNNLPNPEFNDPAKCSATVAPRLTFPAHWAPLGFVFYDKLGLPAAYQGDALIAFHGSGSEQVNGALTGFKVARVRFENGSPVGVEDVVRGWNQGSTNWGRPAGLLVLADGSLLISDDATGRIYRLHKDQ